MKKLEFVRFGGLSLVNYKKLYKQDSFHSPPCKRGIYAFIFPYIEDFLWVWKVNSDGNYKKNINKYHRKNRRKFKYNGNIWCHFIDEAISEGCNIEIKKDWVKVHTDDLNKLLAMVKHSDRLSIKHNYLIEI